MSLCRPEDTLEECARKWRRALRRREKEARDLLLQQYGEVYRWMKGELVALLKEIQEQEGEVSPWHLVRAQRYKTLLAQIEAEMERLAGVAARETEKAQYDALQMAWEGAGEQLRAVGLDVSSFGFPHEAFQEMVGLLANGTPLAEHFARTVTPEAMQQLRRALLAGLAAGWSPSQVARYAAQKGVGLSLARAMTIARTEMMRAYREGTRRRYAKAGIREWIWLSARDRRTCPACLALHGKRFKTDEPQRGHPNCRCTMVPAIEGVDYGLGTGEEWLREQTPEVQEAILGKTGGALYRAGIVQLKDFAKFREDDLGGMWVSRSLKEILGKRRAQRLVQARRELEKMRKALEEGKGVYSLGHLKREVLERLGVETRGNTQIVLTWERRRHYLERHPEIEDFEFLIWEALFHPDEVHRNRQDPDVANFYLRLGDNDKWLRVTVFLQLNPHEWRKHSIGSMRLARDSEVKRGRKMGLKVWP